MTRAMTNEPNVKEIVAEKARKDHEAERRAYFDRNAKLAAQRDAAHALLKEADQWLSSRVISNFTRDLRDRIAALLGDA